MSEENENPNENPEENAVEKTPIPSDTPSLDTLHETLRKYGFQIPEEQVVRLERFCELLWEWNTKINLTRHTTYEKFVTRDLLDTMALAEFHAPGERVLDVGSGCGVPGILLGIIRPDVSVSLAECVGKKAKVLAEIVHELHLPIPVYEALGQDILGNWQFHTLTFRAVASIRKILEWFRGSWPHFDRMLLVKGPKWVGERGEARHYSLFKDLALRKLKEYDIPGEPAPEPNPDDLHPTSGSVILQICSKNKVDEDDMCILTAWETSHSRNKYDNKRHKSRVDEAPVERDSRERNSRGRGGRFATRRDDLNQSSGKTNRIRNNTHRNSGSARRPGKKEHGEDE